MENNTNERLEKIEKQLEAISDTLESMGKSPFMQTVLWEADKTPSGIQLTGGARALNKAKLLGTSMAQTPNGPTLLFILQNLSDGMLAIVSPDTIKGFE